MGISLAEEPYFQYIMMAPCLHTSCFILKWTCLILTTALEITYQKANDIFGPSLGAAVAIDFVVNHPEAVSMLNNRTL